MIQRRWPLVTSLATLALVAASGAYLSEVPIEIGFLVAVGMTVLLFFTLDVFRQYTFAFPAGVFSCLSLLIWGAGTIPWGFAGTVASFALQLILWRYRWYRPSARFLLATEAPPSGHSTRAFLFEGTRYAADWYAVMVLAYLPYRMAGGEIPVDTGSWQQLWLALALLIATNVLWLVTSEIRARELSGRLDDAAPRNPSLFAWSLFGVYLPLPGTVLVLFAVDQFHDKGAGAIFLWTAASLPFHFGMKALLAASTAHFAAEREQDRQRQLGMIAAQASTILHEAVHHIGLLSLLLSTQNDADSPARRVLGDLERTIEHFRVSLRRHETERAPVDLRSLVEEACRSETRGDPLKLRCETDAGGVPCVVLGHAFLLQSAIINVMRNALEASPAGTATELHLEHGDGTIRIVVRDRGAGITPQDRERIFDPAYSQKGKHGLGLGLYLAREIVRSHGGSIKTSDPAAGGTCFTILLPLLASKPERERPERSWLPPASRQRIHRKS